MTLKFKSIIVGLALLTGANASQQLNDEVPLNTQTRSATGSSKLFESLNDYTANANEADRRGSIMLLPNGKVISNFTSMAQQTHEVTRQVPNGTETVRETFYMIGDEKVILSSHTLKLTSMSTSSTSHSSTSSKSSTFGFGF